MNSRRNFVKLLAITSISLVVIPVAACSQVQQTPSPFQTGHEVEPPLGCSELRSNEINGDCG
jgi:hypothetical protein